MEAFFDFLSAHQRTFGWIAFVSFVVFIVSLIALPLLIVNIPSNYFSTHRPAELLLHSRSPWLKFLGKLSKNVLGCVFLIAGLVMLVLPGQGIVTIVAGIILLDFPGKRSLELRVARRPNVLRVLNWIRTRAHRPPLEAPGTADGSQGLL